MPTSEHPLDVSIAEAWPPIETDTSTVPGWTLRATAGVTRRGNTVRISDVVDDPAAAVERARAWYAARSLPLQFLVSDHRSADILAELLGDDVVVCDETVVMTAAIDHERPPWDAHPIAVEDHPGPGWFDAFVELGGRGNTPTTRSALTALLDAPAPNHFLHAGPASRPDAIAQVVVVGPHAVVQCVAVRPEARRRGLARALMQAAGPHAAALGASELVIAVEATNHGARRLYERLGYLESHRYRYLVDG